MTIDKINKQTKASEKNKRNSFSVENLTNASVVIRASDEKLVIDPWFKDGIYDGTWHNFPRLNEDQKLIA